MANKYDLRTVHQSLTGNAEDAVVIADVSTVSAVPTGKTRFLTYLRIERVSVVSTPSAITALTGVIASVATASNLSSIASAIVAGKLDASLQATLAVGTAPSDQEELFTLEVPKDGPNMKNPILSVAGGSCMLFYTEGTASAQIFAQYYDE